MTYRVNLNYIQLVINELNFELPDLEPELIEFYALLVLATGKSTTLEDVHNAWAIWQNRTQPDHRSIIPFQYLTPDIQELDRKYMNAIHRVAERLQTK